MMAWLQAVPKPPEGSKRAKETDRDDPAAKLSRLEKLKRQGIKPQMPPNPAPHIIDRLMEMGITEATGMGAVPLSWREISEWQRNTAVTLAPWEARLIRKLSVAYIMESRNAGSETCPPPWRGEVTQREKEVELAALRMVLG